MGLIEDIRSKAKASGKTIVLPESDDDRTIEALDHILDNGISKIILIGKEEIRAKIVAETRKQSSAHFRI